MHTAGGEIRSMQTQYSYSKVLEVAERVAWRLDDVLPPDAKLDFSRSFLPDTLAGTSPGQLPSDSIRLVLNQIRGHSYLRLFGLVEEFILPFILDHTRTRVAAESNELRALLQFAGEEAKHIELFRRFAQVFEEGFETPCEVIGPARDIAEAVLEHSSLGVALLVLHIEWMTQAHYLESVRKGHSETLDPLFQKLLHYHYLEEVQHAKVDTLVVERLASELSSAEVRQGLTEYEQLSRFLEDGLESQAEHDLTALELATGQALIPGVRAELLAQQRRSYRATFILCGQEHPQFQRTFELLLRL